MAPVDVVVAGHICLDVIPTPGSGDITRFAPGQLLEVGPALFATGGPVANTGLALHRLGVETRLVGKVGDDLFGRAIIELLQAKGSQLADGMVRVSGGHSSYSVIVSPRNGDRMFLHFPGANDTFCAADVDAAVLAGARCFHVGYPPLLKQMYLHGGAELRRLLGLAKATGVTVSLDMAMVDVESEAGQADWVAILAGALPLVDAFLPSAEEMLQLLERPTWERLGAGPAGVLDSLAPSTVAALGARLVAMGAPIVALKLGHHGLYLRTGSCEVIERTGRAGPRDTVVWSNRELWAPIFETTVVGTTGSGDATIAGFLQALLLGMTPAAALLTACATGAASVEALDATSGVRPWPELQARVAAGWRQRQLTLEPAGWKWDTRSHVWIGPRDGTEVGARAEPTTLRME